MAQTYGWTHEYIQGLPISIFMDYWLAIAPLEARRTLDDLNIASYPHMAKKTDRKKFMSHVRQVANSTIKKSGSSVKSMGDIYQQLARKLKGNG